MSKAGHSSWGWHDDPSCWDWRQQRLCLTLSEHRSVPITGNPREQDQPHLNPLFSLSILLSFLQHIFPSTIFLPHKHRMMNVWLNGRLFLPLLPGFKKQQRMYLRYLPTQLVRKPGHGLGRPQGTPQTAVPSAGVPEQGPSCSPQAEHPAAPPTAFDPAASNQLYFICLMLFPNWIGFQARLDPYCYSV